MTTIKLGGVPEHFNLPIHLANEQQLFKAAGIDLQWTDYAGGTGQMTKALRNNEADACILLTEGITADIIKGNPSKIIAGYVESPLIWGIHTGVNNELRNHASIYSKKYAISRFGSGSHLMAIVDAHEKGVELQGNQFSVIKNLDGALDSLLKLDTDVFYWEKFTTKPYVESGQLKRVGEYLTPWPCFMIAATNNALETKKEALKTMVQVIQQSCVEFMQNDQATQLVAKRYQIELEDAMSWFAQTKWYTNTDLQPQMLNKVMEALKAASIIEAKVASSELLTDLFN